MSEKGKLLFVNVYDDGTIRLLDGQLIGNLDPKIDFKLIIAYESKPIITSIPDLLTCFQKDNETLIFENQRLQIINHQHRGD